jgi:YVTN family beta-propeller protein
MKEMILTMKRDPVCNMEVREDTGITAECSGVVHYFCSEGCKDKFLKEMACKLPRTSYDLIIIGGGPAGLTAAVNAATMKINAFLTAKDLGGQAVDSTKIENYMGFDFITGPELIGKFREQLVRSHYIDHVISDVEKIEPMMIDTATFTVAATVKAGKGSHGVAINSSGTFAYITITFADTVSVIDIMKRDIAATVKVGKGPNGISVSPF